VSAIVKRTEIAETEVRDSLAELKRVGAVITVNPDEEVWDARRPDVVAAEILRAFDDRRAQLHELESRLTAAFRFTRMQPTDAMDMELVHGVDGCFQRFGEIQRRARGRVLAIDRPPYYWDEAEITRQEILQSEQMARGVEYRTIYQDSESDAPMRNASMRRLVANGESARVLSQPPIKLSIVDEDVAILPLDPPDSAKGVLVTILIHQSSLLRVLIELFESLWRLAVPVNLAQLNQELSPREREILTLMASGAGDDAIARRLGLSRRTIVRHIGALLEHLGATTRFQAGAQAARRGWL
jgi:DNA-binding CsgD family transcriptional regulator